MLVNLFGLDKNLPKEVDARWEDYLKSKVGNLEISRLQKARIAEIYGLLQHLLTVQGDHMSAEQYRDANTILE